MFGLPHAHLALDGEVGGKKDKDFCAPSDIFVGPGASCRGGRSLVLRLSPDREGAIGDERGGKWKWCHRQCEEKRSATRVRAVCDRCRASARDAVVDRRLCAGGRRSNSRLSTVRQLSYS